MGLMNVGRSEGSEIVQLFGRGVRLKGFQYSLKRSSKLDSSYNPGPLPKGLRGIETLNIFGVRADYMGTFRKYLEDEGLPANEDNYVPINIPTVNLLGNTRLKVIRLKPGYDFKRDVVMNPLDMSRNVKIKIDWTPRVEAMYSGGTKIRKEVTEHKEKLKEDHLALLNWNRIFFALQQMKNERSWYNMELSIDRLQALMANPSWYELVIQASDMTFQDFGRDMERWENITIALLRAYIDRAYKMSKGRWEAQFMETVYMNANDPNFFEEYSIEVRRDQEEWIDKLKELREQILSDNMESDFRIYGQWIQALRFDRHLFFPLLCLKERDDRQRRILVDEETNEPLIKISPVALNAGELTFVEHIREYYNKHKDGLFAGKEVYLLRNESKKGIGFFDTNNFYPDFILWVNDGKKQRVSFIDPKGLRNLSGGLGNPKVQLYKLLKTEIEPKLNDPDIVLNSFILSNTPYEEVSFWSHCDKSVFSQNHIIFQMDEEYIAQLFGMICNVNEIASDESSRNNKTE